MSKKNFAPPNPSDQGISNSEFRVFDSQNTSKNAVDLTDSKATGVQSVQTDLNFIDISEAELEEEQFIINGGLENNSFEASEASFVSYDSYHLNPDELNSKLVLMLSYEKHKKVMKQKIAKQVFQESQFSSITSTPTNITFSTLDKIIIDDSRSVSVISSPDLVTFPNFYEDIPHTSRKYSAPELESNNTDSTNLDSKISSLSTQTESFNKREFMASLILQKIETPREKSVKIPDLSLKLNEENLPNVNNFEEIKKLESSLQVSSKTSSVNKKEDEE